MNSNASIKITNEKFHVSVVLFQPCPLLLTSDLTNKSVSLVFFWFRPISPCHLSLYNRMALGPLLNSSNDFIYHRGK